MPEMHELFTIPEIISAILLTDTDEHVILQNCLLVNRLFSHEATGILWKRCGTDFYRSYGWFRNKIPTAHNLAKITAHDPSRGQYYANQIRQLHFVRQKEDWADMYKGEQWHESLLKLDFPLLESFTSNSCAKEQPQFAPLKTNSPFYAFRTTGNNDLFFHVLKNSPELKSLNLLMDEPVDLDAPYHPFDNLEGEVIRFINATPILSSLSLPFTYRTGIEFPLNTWSVPVLEALSALPALHKLQGQILTSKSLESLPPNSFSALRNLDVKYSGPLQTIPKHFPNLSTLQLELQEPLTSGLGSLAALEVLTSLDITFAEDEDAENEENSFSASDLLTIAHGCPHLHTLNIPSSVTLKMENPCPIGEDITDSTIEELASSLPNLDNLCISINNGGALTHRSIISLAKYCPELSYFSITANISIPELIKGLKGLGETPLEDMTFMRLYQPEGGMGVDYENGAELAEQFLKLAPRLCEFSIGEGSESDVEFQGIVDALIGVPGSRRV